MCGHGVAPPSLSNVSHKPDVDTCVTQGLWELSHSPQRPSKRASKRVPARERERERENERARERKEKGGGRERASEVCVCVCACACVRACMQAAFHLFTGLGQTPGPKRFSVSFATQELRDVADQEKARANAS